MKKYTISPKNSNSNFFILLLVVIGFTLPIKSSQAQTTVNFDDQSTLTRLTTYAGFIWSSPNGIYTINGNTVNSINGYSCSGYKNGVMSGDMVAWNNTGAFPWNITYASSGTISFNSMYLTAAWNNGLIVQIDGLNGTTVINTQQVTLTINPTLVTMNWSNLTGIRISLVSPGSIAGCGSFSATQIAMDDLTYNSCSANTISSISVTPNSTTNTGGVSTNLYLGYGATAATLNAGSGTDAIWSPATYLSCSTCTSTVFTPTTEGNYTLTATNCYGSKTVTICVKDIRVPNTSGTKAAVYICHKEPVTNVTKTQAVLLRGIPSHFQYHSGDKLGVCGNTCASNKRDFDFENVVIDEQSLEVMCSPNPFRQSFKLHYISNSPIEAVVSIYGMTGNLVEKVSLEGVADEAELGSNLPNGIYTVSFIQGDKNRVFRMIKVD